MKCHKLITTNARYVIMPTVFAHEFYENHRTIGCLYMAHTHRKKNNSIVIIVELQLYCMKSDISDLMTNANPLFVSISIIDIQTTFHIVVQRIILQFSIINNIIE